MLKRMRQKLNKKRMERGLKGMGIDPYSQQKTSLEKYRLALECITLTNLMMEDKIAAPDYLIRLNKMAVEMHPADWLMLLSESTVVQMAGLMHYDEVPIEKRLSLMGTQITKLEMLEIIESE